MFLTPISLQNSTNTSSSTLKTKYKHEYSTNITSILERGFEIKPSHLVHPVSQVIDLPLAGLDDPLNVIDARAKIGQLALQLRFLLQDQRSKLKRSNKPTGQRKRLRSDQSVPAC